MFGQPFHRPITQPIVKTQAEFNLASIRKTGRLLGDPQGHRESRTSIEDVNPSYFLHITSHLAPGRCSRKEYFQQSTCLRFKYHRSICSKLNSCQPKRVARDPDYKDEYLRYNISNSPRPCTRFPLFTGLSDANEGHPTKSTNNR